MTTPEEFAKAIATIGNFGNVAINEPKRQIQEFITTASAAQLRAGVRLVKEVNGLNMGYVQNAIEASHLRFQEESLAATERHIKQTEELNVLTNSHINQSKILSRQTEILISESKKLGWLTWGLFALTVGLLVLTSGLLYIDWQIDFGK